MTRLGPVLLAACVALLPARPAAAAENASNFDFFLGAGATLGTVDYGHRLERRNGGGLLLGTRGVLAAPVGPIFVGAGFAADVAGGPHWNSLDDWTGVYGNYAIEAGLVAGAAAGGRPVLLQVGGALRGDTAYVDDFMFTAWFARLRVVAGPSWFDAGASWMPERNLAQVMAGARLPIGPTSSDGGLKAYVEVHQAFGLASHNGGTHVRAGVGFGM